MGSEQWRNLRAQAISRDGRKCCHCGSKYNLHVHHHTYPGTTKDGQWHLDCKENLTTLCKECHRQEHELIKAGRRAKLTEARVYREKSDAVVEKCLNLFWMVFAIAVIVFFLTIGFEILLVIVTGPAVILSLGWLATKLSSP